MLELNRVELNTQVKRAHLVHFFGAILNILCRQ